MKIPNYLKIIIFIFIIRLILLLTISNLITEEEYVHYAIIKSGFVSFKNLLCFFGKPGFSLLGYLFLLFFDDIFGMFSLRLMNVLFSVFSSYYCYKILLLYNFDKEESEMGIIFFNFTDWPLLFFQSGLTEPSAIFFMICGFYYYKIKAYRKSSFLFSFAFLIRFELIIIICFIGLDLFFKKKKVFDTFLLSIFPILYLILLYSIGYAITQFFFHFSLLKTLYPEKYVVSTSIPSSINPFTSFTYIVFFYGIFYFWLFLVGIYNSIKNKKLKFELVCILIYIVYGVWLFIITSDNYQVVIYDFLTRYLLNTSIFNYIFITTGYTSIKKKIMIKGINAYNIKNIIVKIRAIFLIFVVIESVLFLNQNILIFEDDKLIQSREIRARLKESYDLDKTSIVLPYNEYFLYDGFSNIFIYIYTFDEFNNKLFYLIKLEGFFYESELFKKFLERIGATWEQFLNEIPDGAIFVSETEIEREDYKFLYSFDSIILYEKQILGSGSS